jgi:hypothetical protein
MVLGGRPPGRVGRRRNYSSEQPQLRLGLFAYLGVNANPSLDLLAYV